MGCLFELFGELVVDGYVELMSLVLPRKKLGRKARSVLELVVEIFSILLLVCILFGAIQCFETDPWERMVGKYMVWIPVGIIVSQIALGIVVRVIAGKRSK